ncbi:MAG TPA: response regulator [Burkholderiaceae bacterium]|nr:response regulator [Burkholderiaceae bacterium]
MLLVEDNEFNRIVATEWLSDVAGMRVSVAVNGEQAVELIRSERFDAVLMDVQMPVMDGCQATTLIRQDPSLADLPIIAMTAHAMARDRDKCLAVGMNDHVSKPFDSRELFAVLARWIEGKPLAEVAAPAASQVPAANAPAVSFDVGLQLCLGRSELYREIVDRFLDRFADEPSKVEAAVAGQHLQAARAVAHSMVSSASILGAEPLASAARALEQGVVEGDPERLQSLVLAFRLRHGEVLAELRAYVARESAHKDGGSGDDKVGD